MKRLRMILFAFVACVLSGVPNFAMAMNGEALRWKNEAAAVSVTRDDWGIAHVHGRTDADAVFGMIYAQCEDDFRRVESNYLIALGRTAEAEGEGAIWKDLRQRLFLDPEALKADYAKSPHWLRVLMNAWADGINFYLARHPDVKPKVIAHYEPWMALSFTEGSIGGDIEDVKLAPLEEFYGKTKTGRLEDDRTPIEPRGSNGIAIAPSDSADGHALLLINPHVTFFFRSELQMTSDQGLDAYGAVTWGQIFVYQGFNPHIGWMHTSTSVDNVDEFAETIVRRDGKLFTAYGNETRPVRTKTITLAYRNSAGGISSRSFTTYETVHGPVVRAQGDKWISVSLMNRPIAALEQSYLRTKTHDLESYLKVARLQANSSNNTVLADDKGEIAFFVPQFVPLRDDRFDYTEPVNGADPATDWSGVTPLAKLPHVIDPPKGWVFNSNDWPWSAAGPDGPKRENYPRYLDQFGENERGIHATKLLTERRNLTPDALEAIAFDPYLPAFAELIPSLVEAYDETPSSDPLKGKLADQIAALRSWDFRWAKDSVATTLAVTWGDTLWSKTYRAGQNPNLAALNGLATETTAADKLSALAEASDRLVTDFGTWRVAWGDFNRYQRLDDGPPHFDDSAPSLAVPFVSSRWGSLASFGARRYPGTKRYYGVSGNSFVAIVDFGPKVRARAVSTGGESGDPASRHFNDQAERYANGKLRTVYFYPEDLKGHIERVYHPGM